MRYPAYRTYWLGTLGSVSGWQVLMVAWSWLLYDLSGSPLVLGYAGLAGSLPSMVLTPIGGVVADRVDKRMLVAAAELTMVGLTLLLATLTLAGVVEIWHVLAIVAVAGVAGAFEAPAHEALYPSLIGREAMTSAVALDAAVWNGTRIVMPAAAGIAIAVAGTASAIYLSSMGFLLMAVAVARLRTSPVKGGAGGPALTSLVEGFRFVVGNPACFFLIGMTFFNSFFGMGYIMLMPVFAKDILRVGAGGQGVLLSAGGVGALAVTLWLIARSPSAPRGLLLIGGAAATGLSIVAFGLTSHFVGSYPLAVAIMFASGAFNSTYTISIMSSLQLMVPDEYRGRVMGLYSLTWSMMPLGAMQAGAIANVIGAPLAAAVGGAAVVAFAIGPALLNKRLLRPEAPVVEVERPGPAS